MDDRISFFNIPTNTVHDTVFADKISLSGWDEMLSKGWRHNGMLVFRTSHDTDENDFICRVIPLRNVLKKFKFTKSQTAVFKRNQDLTFIIRPTNIDDEKHDLFFQHVEKFKTRRPSSIYDFISPEPKKPFKTWELCVYKDKKLIACSFMDVTPNSISSTYAMYDLTESKRSLGIFTMVLEIKFAIEKRKKFYYPGYAYETPSFYDYKKKFDNTEYLNWQNMAWLPMSSSFENAQNQSNSSNTEGGISFL